MNGSGPVADGTVEQLRRARIGQQRRAQTRARIIAAAFDLFGDENGLYARIEDVADHAGVTRATFYNHFNGMLDLREALSHEVTHEFLSRVKATIDALADPRERSAVAIRYYLRRAASDRRWAYSMLNISASGHIFGVETHRQAEHTIREGIAAGCFPINSVDLGRDILLGTCVAAMGSLVREQLPASYPETVAGHILQAMGVPPADARRIAHLPLPELVAA